MPLSWRTICHHVAHLAHTLNFRYNGIKVSEVNSMKKETGGPLSFKEWFNLFDLLEANAELKEILKKLEGRDRTTINRAYNVAREIRHKGNLSFDELEIKQIIKVAKYGTTEKYVTDAVYKYKSWLKKDIIQEVTILPKNAQI